MFFWLDGLVGCLLGGTASEVLYKIIYFYTSDFQISPGRAFAAHWLSQCSGFFVLCASVVE